MTFSETWNKILLNEGELFHTKTRKEFRYKIDGNNVVPDRTDYPLHISNFEKAYKMMPISGPGEISNDVRGSSYVWAILNDKRIK